MTKMRRSLLFLAVAVLVTSLPALAETFSVVLKNGSQFETRYRPTVAEWDNSKVLLVTATGTRITLSRDDIETVTADTEVKGYGTLINTTTIAIGLAPNDAPVPSGELEAQSDPLSQILQYLQRRPPRRRQVANVRQFVEPPVAGEVAPGGFPVWNLINLDLMPRTTPPATP